MKTRAMIVLLSSCLLLGACGAGNDKQEAAGAEDDAQTCGTHESIARPDWLPADLPLPDGTEVIEVAEKPVGSRA